ncbi:hypothetical protein B0H66DRAFT_632240 [Apodospora peruviana]|uniref:Membrane-associated protein n=1 Tax=Apodospora peruviana TaxID=516989 RepID=A0AAE0HUI3_9PEZI|nr:hypothetical protein B0H66DRAFT_632240 [Apodospora peruviana]
MELATLIVFALCFLQGAASAVVPAQHESSRRTTPHWLMVITNLSASSVQATPYVTYDFNLHAGMFTPAATCHGQILLTGTGAAAKRANSDLLLVSTDWITCAVSGSVSNNSNDITAVAFKWSQVNTSQGSNNSSSSAWQLLVDSNFTITAGANTNSTSSTTYVYQRGTYNISSEDILKGQTYTGPRNMSTNVLAWVCDGRGRCR